MCSECQVDDSGEIIQLEQGCPWKEHLLDLEEKLSLPELCIKFVLYKETESDKWRIQVKREGESGRNQGGGGGWSRSRGGRWGKVLRKYSIHTTHC